MSLITIVFCLLSFIDNFDREKSLFEKYLKSFTFPVIYLFDENDIFFNVSLCGERARTRAGGRTEKEWGASQAGSTPSAQTLSSRLVLKCSIGRSTDRTPQAPVYFFFRLFHDSACY